MAANYSNCREIHADIVRGRRLFFVTILAVAILAAANYAVQILGAFDQAAHRMDRVARSK